MLAVHPLATSVVEFCNQNPRGCIRLEGDRGVGKSLLLDDLSRTAAELDLLLVRCPIKVCAARGAGTMVEHLNDWLELTREDLKTLELPVLRDLNVRNPESGARLAAYLNALALVNRCGIVVALEDIDRLSASEAATLELPDELPHGVYLIVTFARAQLAPGLAAKLDAMSGLELKVLTGPGFVAERWPSAPRNGSPRLAFWAAQANFPVSGESEESFFAALTAASDERLLCALAACAPMVSLERLAAWGFDPRLAMAACPPLFLHVRGYAGLADEGFRAYLQARPLYPEVLGELFERQRTQPNLDELDFVRLYSWAVAGKERAAMERICHDKPLNEARLALFARLEMQFRFHQKVEVLTSWRALLARAAELGDLSVREELAWAHNSRGLAYLSMGLFGRGMQDIDEAIRWFEQLVERERQTHLANGLAAATNRRSEALRQLNQLSEALEGATRAIELYARVTDRDVSAMLAMAHQNRALIRRSLGELTGAEEDVERAIELLTPRAETGPLRLRRDLSAAWHTRAGLLLGRGQFEPAVQSAARAIELLEKLGSVDVANELAGAHNNRGAAHHRLAEFEQAHAAYTESIRLRSELVERGRLDLRNDLAGTYANRAIVSQSLQKLTDALADYERAVEIRTLLVEGEGRLDLAPDLAQLHIYRGQVLRAQGQMVEARDDYQRAIDVYSSMPGQAPPRELALAFNGLALVQLDQGHHEDALRSCRQALEQYERLPAEEVVTDVAVALNNRGEAYRRLKRFTEARRDFEEAMGIYHEQVQAGGQQPFRELAITRQNLARVKLATSDFAGSLEDSTRALEILLVLLEEQGRAEVLPHLVAAYTTRGVARVRLDLLEAGLKDLGRSIDLYKFLIEDREQSIFLDELGDVYFERAQALLKLGKASHDTPDRMYFPKQALDDYNRALQSYEMAPAGEDVRSASARCRVARSRLQEDLGDFSAALLDASNAIDYYQGRGAEALVEFLDALKRRAEIYLHAGQYELALHDYLRVAETVKDNYELRGELAEAANNVAWTRTCLGQYGEAFADYATSLALYRKLVLEEKRLDLGKSLAWTYNNRAATHNIAGNPKGAVEDYSNAVDIYTFLVEQGGQPELRPRLATTLNNRGLLFQGMAVMDRAVQDFTRALEVRAQAARGQSHPEVLVELASAYSTRGLTFHKDGRTAYALADYRAASEILTDLVENRRRLDLGNELARCLLAQGVLGPDLAQDPDARKALTKAISVVTTTLKAGFPVTASFPLHFLRVVSKIAEGAAYLLGGLPESVLALSDALLKSKNPPADPMAYGELLLGLSNRLPTAKVRLPLAVLAALFLQMAVERAQTGALARLVNALLVVGQLLAAKPTLPEGGLAGIGECFSAATEALRNTLISGETKRELEQAVGVWKGLPESILESAQVTEAGLTAALRAL